MTPIEIIEGRYGYKILTGVAATDVTALKVVAIVIRSAGAEFAVLKVNTVDVITPRNLTGLLEVTDPPILAGYDDENRSTKFFTNITMTNASDSICMYFSE